MPQPKVRSQLVQRLAIEADIARTVAVFDRADAGQTWDLFDLYDDGLLRDSRLRAVCQKRVTDIIGARYVVQPMPDLVDDPWAKEISKRCSTILAESPRFDDARGRLAFGVLGGLGVAEIDWRINARGWYVPRLEWRHGNLFGFDDNGDLGVRLNQRSTQVVPLSEYPDKFVVHTPSAGHATYTWRQGALRARILPSMVKRNGVRWWAILLERWGQPQVYANQQDGDANDTAIVNALKVMSEYWQAVFPSGVEPKTIPMSGQVNSEAHARFIELANTDDAIAILGQNLTTEVQGGSYAATEAHRSVADAILRADLVELAETLNQQLIEPIVRYNWPGAPVPRIRFVAERQQIVTVEDVREGIFSEDDRRAAMGYEPKADGKGSEYRTPPSSLPSQGLFSIAPHVAQPSGGADAEAPFRGPSSTTTATPSPTGARWTHPLASALSRR